MHALALALLLLTAPAGAATIVLDFEEEPGVGVHTSSFPSAECGGCVQLVGFQGEHLHVEPFSDTDPDLVLVVGDEGGQLVLEFLVPVVAVSLDFG